MKYFQDLKRPCAGTIGNKAANLRRAFLRGFPIPPTAVLPAENAASLQNKRGRAELLAEAKALFSPVMPVIVRSSSEEEDADGATFAGIFESVEVHDFRHFEKALAKVLGSADGRKAKAYRKARGLAKAAGKMAVMVQPLIKSDFAGAALYEKDCRVTIDLSRSGNRKITAGGDSQFTAVFELSTRSFSKRPDDKNAMLAAKAALDLSLKAGELLFPGRNSSIEFAVIDGNPVLLQARSVETAAKVFEMDMAALYLKIHRAMTALGLSDGGWGIAETLDFAAFNYLGRTRKSNETMEHIRIRLHGEEAQRARTQGWRQVRNSSTVTLFPPASDRNAAEIISGLAKESVTLIFEPLLDDELPLKTSVIESGGERCRIRFSIPSEGLEEHEQEYLRNRLADSNLVWHVTRFTYELEAANALCAALASKKSRYEKELFKFYDRLAELARRRLKLSAVPVAPKTVTLFSGQPLVKSKLVVRARALTPARIMTARGKGYIFVANDLEPSFISCVGKLAGVVVARGTKNSHAAAICAELGIPLIYGAKGIAAVREGEPLEANFGTGAVTRLKGAA